MKLRWKNIFLGLSLFFCLLSAIAWGFGIAGKGFHLFLFGDDHTDFYIAGVRGAIVPGFAHIQRPYMRENWWPTPIRLIYQHRTYSGYQDLDSEELSIEARRVFVLLNYRFASETRLPSQGILILPYWLLIILFGAGPVMRWRARYVERRDKKFFEEAAAAKRQEQG